MIVVTDGLKAGEKVIVEGFQKVRQGTQVLAKPYTDSVKSQEAQSTSAAFSGQS
jgi:membrane fusion protein (multidrug efflux system)